ncbi:hypothetical protein CH255_19645 [Rhodococcus sp. 05-2255-2A2]|uniref:DUF7352 domain-containing protein n=1 Tax=unclassified Rhodococcus (in: high G+C Gram-positive bacteria) TaxID=192944 RepID=UPI000B9B63F5|nr:MULTISPECIES: hypothetical protein [unclassified Rhodococcus (in: high G+C Gram-positive bacteria)]OZE03866.1 hypothetical protein CH250_22495 [Rhodococcus sp. 05-2255-3C]OZE17019.1 hypothetical protein CH255_19645 [Rhodococcus sp. 05-2255-2A2]
MSNTFNVFRHSIPIDAPEFYLPLTPNSVLLSVAESRDRPLVSLDVWVRVPKADRYAAQTNRYAVFRIAGTGHDVEAEDATEFLGTVVTGIGLVWHVFYRFETSTDGMAIR